MDNNPVVTSSTQVDFSDIRVNEMRYVTIRITNNHKKLRLVMTKARGTLGDPIMFVRYGNTPKFYESNNQFSFDHFDQSSWQRDADTQVIELNEDRLVAGDYFVGIFNYRAYSRGVLSCSIAITLDGSGECLKKKRKKESPLFFSMGEFFLHLTAYLQTKNCK